MRIHLLTSLVALIASLASLSAAEIITVRGSPVVARAFSLGIEQLSKDHGIEINFVAESQGLETVDRLGREIIDIGLFTRKLTATEKQLRPEKRFTEILLGKQAVLVVVPDQVWNSGVRALSKDQLVKIYERDVKNWKELGGEDRGIVYYNREPARGVWDLFMLFLYEDLRKAPLSKAEVLNSGEEVRNAVEFNGAAISVIEYSELKDARLHPLGIKMEDGTIIEPTKENIASGRYEMSRPLVMVTSKRPTGKVQELVKFMTGPDGQECVKKAGHVTLADLGGDGDAKAAAPVESPADSKTTKADDAPTAPAALPPAPMPRSSWNPLIVTIIALAIIAIVFAIGPFAFRNRKRVAGHHSRRH